MVASADIRPDRVLLTDATSGNIKGLRLNNGYLSVVDGGLNVLHHINNYSSGTYANRPVAGTANLFYYSTDTEELFWDNGTAWVTICHSYPTALHAYHTGTVQDVPTGADTKVTLNAEKYDAFNEFDKAAAYRFTADYDGYYHITGAVSFGEAPADGSKVAVKFYRNGVTLGSPASYTTGAAKLVGVNSAIDYELSAGDYIELYVYHDHGANRQLAGGPGNTYMAIHRIG